MNQQKGTTQMNRLAPALAAAALALAASAADVVIYSPYCADGLTVSAPSGVYRYPASYTGHRAVVRLPDASGAKVEGWTGSGDFSVTAAYGTTAGRDADVLDLRLHSPVLPRLMLKTASQGNATSLSEIGGGSNCEGDRCRTVAEYYQGLKDVVLDLGLTDEARSNMLKQLIWVETNRACSAAVDANSTETTRVRIVRWAVDGQPVYRVGAEAEVVLDRRMLLSDRAFLTEADVLATGAFDLDWEKLKDEVVDYRGVQLAGCPVTNVAYLVVIGDGKTCWWSDTDTNSCPKILDRVIERRYSLAQAATAPVDTNATFRTTRPTLKWKVDAEDSPYTGYTCFQLRLMDAGGATLWTSDTTLLPHEGADGVYAWRLPSAASSHLAAGTTYKWRVSVMNSKFNTPSWTDAKSPVATFAIQAK
jgi:hypothetical protein